MPRRAVQGVVFDRFVELDYEEVAARKARAIMTKPALGDTLRAGNAVDDAAASAGRITSAQYTLAPADLRQLDQARCLHQHPYTLTGCDATQARPRSAAVGESAERLS